MKSRLTLIFAFLLTTSLAQGQVTIGSNRTTLEGALLMLDDGTAINNTMVNSTKGMNLPRVKLTNLKPQTPAELSKSIGSSGNWDLNEHVGLTVYNAVEGAFNVATCKYEGAPTGLYVWDSKQWNGMGDTRLGEDVRTVIDDYDGKITISYKGENTQYRYSTFGKAGTWMIENLATQYLPDGTLLNKHTVNSITDPQYFVPLDLAETDPLINNTNKYGLLYNWAASTNRMICNTTDQAQIAGSTPGSAEVESTDGSIKGICPKGWHLPSDREWNELEKEIATQTSKYAQTLPNGTWDPAWESAVPPGDGDDNGKRPMLGKAMKTKDTFVTGTNPKGDSKTAANGGFDMLLVGYARDGWKYDWHISYFWSSSSHNQTTAWCRYGTDYADYETRTRYGRDTLFSIRCKKN